jgi:transposase
MKSKAYRTSDVKQIDLDKILHGRCGQAAVLGVDISKKESRLMLRWNFDDFERPWSSVNPGEISRVADLCRRLSIGRKFSVAMESSGTYGDALRQALTDAGLCVMRVSSKASHDYAEIFDGVDSQHDGKDAAIIAELCAMNKAAPWPWRDKAQWEQEMNVIVDDLESARLRLNRNTGHLEALLARHWPEVLKVLGMTSRTLLSALHHYGGPAALAADPKAAERLHDWSSHNLVPEKIQAIVDSAKQSVGVRPGAVESQRLKQIARRLAKINKRMRRLTGKLQKLAEGQTAIQSMGQVVGVATACVLWITLGDPANYRCAAAYRKAMGLNLKERSSGQYQGQLKLSKRGNPMARRWLYLAALRLIRASQRAKSWYGRKRKRFAAAWLPRPGHRPRPGIGAVASVMRKLSLALHHVAAHQKTFDAKKLFNVADAPRKKSGGSSPASPSAANKAIDKPAVRTTNSAKADKPATRNPAKKARCQV